MFVSFIQHKSLVRLSILDVAIFGRFDIGIDIKNPELLWSKSIEMNKPQTCRDEVCMLVELEVHLYTIIPSPWVGLTILVCYLVLCVKNHVCV